jgi:hypothetical protein
MTYRIDRIRAATAAHASRIEREDAEALDVETVGLPVPVGPVVQRHRGERRGDGATFQAQMYGQDGQKRGLRGGAPVLGAARQLYSSIEWSGGKDRRAPKGRWTRTEA